MLASLEEPTTLSEQKYQVLQCAYIIYERPLKPLLTSSKKNGKTNTYVDASFKQRGVISVLRRRHVRCRVGHLFQKAPC